MYRILILFLLISTLGLAQSWNNTVTTTINIPNLKTMDLFTNNDGNHLIVHNSYPNNYYIRYYLLNSSGSVTRVCTLETSSSASFPNIDGDNEIIYAVYKFGNYLRVRKSTNAGQSWLTNIPDKSIGSNTCNGVDAIYDSRGLHIVYAMQDNGNDYETYYYRIDEDNAWEDYQVVTNYGTDVGGFPTVSVSEDRVHVSFNAGTSYSPETNLGDAKTRDKYNSTWQSSQLIYADESFINVVHASQNKLFDFYYRLDDGLGQYHSDLYVRERTFTGNWSGSTFLQNQADLFNPVSATTTTNNNTHIVYPGTGSVLYRSYNGSSWSSESTIGDDFKFPNITSVSNDLYTVWQYYSTGYIKYRQYDAVPLAPTNLDWSNTGSPNFHPVISWGPVGEPDVRENTQTGILIERRFYNSNRGVWGTWSLVADTTGEASSWTDKSIRDASGAGPGKVAYRLRAKDIGNNISPYSETIEIVFGTSPEKMNLGRGSFNYTLNQNFPNPFNPATKISYSIKEDGFVSLKIYDNLGREVKTLVSETQSAGKHNADFDATDLPSGMYIYTIRSGNYVQTRKMVLLK